MNKDRASNIRNHLLPFDCRDIPLVVDMDEADTITHVLGSNRSGVKRACVSAIIPRIPPTRLGVRLFTWPGSGAHGYDWTNIIDRVDICWDAKYVIELNERNGLYDMITGDRYCAILNIPGDYVVDSMGKVITVQVVWRPAESVPIGPGNDAQPDYSGIAVCLCYTRNKKQYEEPTVEERSKRRCAIQ